MGRLPMGIPGTFLPSVISGRDIPENTWLMFAPLEKTSADNQPHPCCVKPKRFTRYTIAVHRSSLEGGHLPEGLEQFA